jgi:Domain of unknown function (DUF4082)/PEP-CTERM motif
MTVRNLSAVVLLLGAASIGRAGTLALDIFANTSNDETNGNFSVGWKFTVSSPITVVALDYYASTLHPDVYNHAVGIFDSSQNLLFSTTVLTSDPTVGNGNWLEHAITPQVLTSGTYYIAGFTSGDYYTVNPTSETTIPQITWVADARIDSSSLVFPSGTSNYTNGNAWFGPSFEVAASVPEPSTFALLAGGLALAGLKLRKSRRP